MKKLSTLLVLLLTMFVGGVNCAYAQDGFLDRSKWTVTVSSDCDDSGNGSQGWAKYLTDDNVNTYWHSNWQGTTADKAHGDPEQQLPQFIIVDLGEVQDVQTIVYSPRLRTSDYWNTDGNGNNGMNGCALEYEIYLSNEAFDFTQSTENGSAKTWYESYAASHSAAGTGTFSYAGDASKTQVWKYASLDAPKKAQYVMFVIKGSTGNSAGQKNKYANCSEFQIAPSKDVALAFAKKNAQSVYEKEAVAINIDEKAVGYYKPTTIQAWEAELNTANTLEEVEKVENKYYRNLNLPISGKLYRIVSGNDNFMNNQNVRKVLLSTGNNSYGWNTEDKTDVAQYWWITTDGDGYKFQNVKTGTYVSGMSTLNDAGSTVTMAFPKAGVENFRVNGGTVHANGHNQGNGKSGNIVNFGTFGFEAGGPSAWIIEDVTLEQAQGLKFPTTYPFTESVNYGGKEIYPVGAYKIEAAQLKFESTMPNVSSLDEANEKLRATFPFKPVQFEAGKYYRIVCPLAKVNEDHNALSINSNNKVCTEVYDNASINQLWKVLTDDGGATYYIQQANSGKYVGDVINASNKRIDAVTEKNLFELYQYTDVTTSQYRIHQANNNNQNNNLFAENGSGDGFACSVWINQGDRRAASWYFLPIDDVEVVLNTVESNSYATAYLPFDVCAVTGAKAYVGELNTEKNALNMTEVTSVPAEKGFVLVGDADATKATLTIGTAATNVTSDLQGTNTVITLDEAIRTNYLVFGKDKNSNAVGFYTPSASVPSIPANKAYLNTSAPAAIALNFNGTTTGVNTVVLGENGVNAPIFDLSGRRVVKAVKGGVYIQNGKKFVK